MWICLIDLLTYSYLFLSVCWNWCYNMVCQILSMLCFVVEPFTESNEQFDKGAQFTFNVNVFYCKANAYVYCYSKHKKLSLIPPLL